MHTIIGAGGAVAIPLAKELNARQQKIRLVSRNPKKVNDTDELFSLDVSDLSRLDSAVAGSEVVFVTIGFEYSIKVWRSTWPPFMLAIIDACKKHRAKLVFFDNVYSYAKSAIPHMTEESPLDPPSKKGGVRKIVHEMIMGEVERGQLTALIARAGDFYGPDCHGKSVLEETVVKNLRKGKSAQVFGNPDKIHTYTFTPDAGKATAQLGLTPDAFNQVWHLPTTKDPLTTRQWVELIAAELNTQPKIMKVAPWILTLMGVFVPVIREFPEMMYQNEVDYIFDSSKFEKKFGWKATAPKDGIRAMLAQEG